MKCEICKLEKCCDKEGGEKGVMHKYQGCHGECSPKMLEITIKIDGTEWVAHRSDFENLQESLAGFGDSPLEALSELFGQESIEKFKKELNK